MDAASIIASSEAVTVEDSGESSDGIAVIGGEQKQTPPPAAPLAEEKKEEFIAPRFALLAKEEKRLQEERKRISEERKNPEYQEFLEFKKIKASAKNDPLSVMEKLGLTYDELTDYVISGKHTKDPSVKALEDKLAKMEAEAKEREAKAKKDYEEAELNHFRETIKNECLKNTEDFELVNLHDAHGLVYNVIQKHYDNTGKVLSINEAAKKVEDYLETETQKFQGSKKLQKLFGVSAKAAEADTSTKADTFSMHSMTQTLSNNASASNTSTDEHDDFDPQTLVQKAAKLIMR